MTIRCLFGLTYIGLMLYFLADIKSMVSAGLTTLSSCNYDLLNAVNGRKDMRVLCIGHGGGSLPLFLASKIKGLMSTF